MKFDCTINIVDLLTLISSFALFFIGLRISSKVSAKQRFEHEKEISNYIRQSFKFGQSVILADTNKYYDSNSYNDDYRIQGAEFYDIVPAHGVRVILRPDNEKIPVATVPFDWIEYIRDYDSEDNKFILICKFKGIKFYKNYKSPFKKIDNFYKNNNYKVGDPESFKFTQFTN